MEVPQERNINSGWTFVGPSSSPLLNAGALYNGIGRVDRIVFHPSNSNIIFLCTPAGGLWNTLNGGTTWNNLTDYLPSIGISGFVISYANTSDMYLLTGDGDSNTPTGFVNNIGYLRPSIGVLKSTDGGVSWHETGAFPNVTGPYVGYELIQSPEDPDLLLAATSNGIYRTTNGGDTWVRELSLKTYDIEFKPGAATRVYASVDGDFWISTNSGDSWTSNSTYDVNPNTCGSNGGGRIEIAVAPSNSGKVYLLAGPATGNGVFCGLWLSTDSGASFTLQSNTPNVLGTSDSGVDTSDQSNYDLAIAVRPTLSTSIVVGGCTVWRSTDGGGSWTHATSYKETGSFPYIHPDIHDLAFNPVNNWLYAVSDGGFFRSEDYGVTWADLSPNIETSQLYHMAGWSGNINKLMGGFQDNGVKYRKTNSSAFNHIQGGDGFDVVFNPLTGQPAFTTVNDTYTVFTNDGQGSNSYYLNQGYYFQTLAIHNVHPDTALIGSYDIFKTTNGGSNWYDKGASGSWALTSCPSNSSRFYAAGGVDFQNGSGSLYFSNDIGETWTAKSGNSGFPSSSNWVKITDIAVRPTASSTVWACFGGFDDGYKVVTSNNTGDTWTNMSANLPNVPVNCLAIDSDNGAYAGTDIGVFYRGPSMSNWMPWSNGLPNCPVTELVIFDDGVNKRIRAATFGRGVWQSNPAATCDAAVVVTGNMEGVRHFEASNSISSSSAFVEGGIGTFVSFKSGNYITLSEGFNVVDDSEFLGFISPCGEGGIPGFQGDETEFGATLNKSNAHPSLVVLRRAWDQEDGVPYGALGDVEVVGGALRLEYDIHIPGDIQISLVGDQAQNTFMEFYSGKVSSGWHTLQADISSLPKGHYFLLLTYADKLAHFQELELK